MLWPDEKRVPYATVRERMADGSDGARMRRIKGARHAHAVMRAQGRTPGAEGRAKIRENRRRRAEEKRQTKIAELSLVTTGERGLDGLTEKQREANQMLKECWAQEERDRVERLRAEWEAKQKRLSSPVSSGRVSGLTGSMSYPY